MGVVRMDSKKQGGTRFYRLADGRKLPSVTSILSIIAKPALITWAANQEREHVITVAVNTYKDSLELPDRLSTSAFATTLQERLPKQRRFAKVAGDAANIGTAVHAFIEYYLLSKLGIAKKEPVIIDDARRATDTFQEWATSVNLSPLIVEATVYHSSIGYAGTVDAIVELDHPDTGERIAAVSDWKTSNALYPEHWMQVSAYANADNADASVALAEDLRDEQLDTESMYGLIVRFDKKKIGVVEPKFQTPTEMKAWFTKFTHAKQLWDDMRADEDPYGAVEEAAQ